MACKEVYKRAQSPIWVRPDMSLKIVLVGKNVSENNRVGNFILNKQVFGKRALQPDVEMFNEIVEERDIRVINTINMLKSNISILKIAQKVSEFSLSEPDVIILVLQHNDFSKKKRLILPSVLKCFGGQMMKRSMILTTDDEKRIAKQKPVNEYIQQISTECGGFLQLTQNIQRSQILQTVDEIICSTHKETQQISLLHQEHIPNVYSSPQKQKLVLAMCGCDEEMKASMSKLLLGKNRDISVKQEFRSVRLMDEEMIHGHLISLVELPALNRLSEEEVMCQTLICVSLCDPGVHAFLLIVPDAPLTDEDKAEIEKIVRIFDSRENFFLLFITNLSVEGPVTDLIQSSPDSKRLIGLFGGQYGVIGLNEPENSRQIPELLDYIANMKTEPLSPQKYVKVKENKVRHKLEEKHNEQLQRMESEIQNLKQKIQSKVAESESDDQECLRIVLIGRTGNGKSATGNTILGRNEFHSQLNSDSVTKVCQKGVGEVADRSVAVVDTPGLFDTTLSNDQVVEEIVKCVSLSSPGPHVFVIVLSLLRFTREETDTIDLIKKIFGHKAAQFSIVLFTRGDDLENESIEDYVKRSNSAELKKLIRDCGNRFLVFNNREIRDTTQVIQLLTMIDEVKNMNQGRYFTNSMFEEAEMSIKKKMEEILKEREREIEIQTESLKAKYEMEMEKMIKRLEGEKERVDNERMQMENQFREKEEKLRKEFEEKEKQSEEEKQQRAEYHKKIEEMKREIEYHRSQYEKQQKEREEEERKREEKYRQDQEKMKNEQKYIIAELQMKQEEEIKIKENEYQRKIEEEEQERQRWKIKIKEAENDRKEIQEELKRQQREWEEEKKQQMREQEDDERKRKERHQKQLTEKQEELDKMRKIFEREREEERLKIEDEIQKHRREREEKEKEYEDKKIEMKIHYERKKQEEDEKREEERKMWKTMIKDLKQEQEKIKRKEKEEKKKKHRKKKEMDELKKEYEEKMKDMKKKHKDEARKQAEAFNELTERKLKHVLDLDEMLKDSEKQHKLLEKLHKHLQEQKGEEIQELKKEVEKLKNKSGCVIL